MIENPKQRIVHFYFKAAFPRIESEFTLRMRLYLKKRLDLYLQSQSEKMEEYIRKIQNDELEESSHCPIKQIPNSLLEFDVSLVRTFALSTSDDPYYEKSLDLQKYFPEAVFYNESGEVLGKLDAKNPEFIGNYIGEC